jgi:hypothetical protein
MRNSRLSQNPIKLEKMSLVSSSQSYCDRVRRNTIGSTLSCCVDRLRDLRPMREVGADDHIVNKVSIRVAFAVEPGVNA